MSDLIGPLTAGEWCSFRATGGDDDILYCCANTSELRDAIFHLLRMGAESNYGFIIEEAWITAIGHHDFNYDTEQGRSLVKLRDYYSLPKEEDLQNERDTTHKS